MQILGKSVSKIMNTLELRKVKDEEENRIRRGTIILELRRIFDVFNQSNKDNLENIYGILNKRNEADTIGKIKDRIGGMKQCFTVAMGTDNTEVKNASIDLFNSLMKEAEEYLEKLE